MNEEFCSVDKKNLMLFIRNLFLYCTKKKYFIPLHNSNLFL